MAADPQGLSPSFFPKPSLRVRFYMWRRRIWFRLAILLVRKMDGVVVNGSALRASVTELAKLQSVLGDALGRQKLGEALQRRLGGAVELLAVSAEAGDPRLQAQQLAVAYARMRQLTMSRRERLRSNMLEAHRQLRDGARDRKLFRAPPTGKTKAAPAAPGKVPAAVAAAMAQDDIHTKENAA